MYEQLVQKVKNLPSKPGVYLFSDAKNEIIYIGKASSLKKRVSSYFKMHVDAKTNVLVSSIHGIDYIITQSEIEALLLESSLIKKHRPKYNISKKTTSDFLTLLSHCMNNFHVLYLPVKYYIMAINIMDHSPMLRLHAKRFRLSIKHFS